MTLKLPFNAYSYKTSANSDRKATSCFAYVTLYLALRMLYYTLTDRGFRNINSTFSGDCSCYLYCLASVWSLSTSAFQ